MNDALLAFYVVGVIVVRILFIFGCISIARRKGRDTAIAGIMGFFFGLWALIGYSLVSSKKSRKSQTLLPACPVCESETVLRTVKGGKDTGKQFYVCMKYPKCKGRVQVRKKQL